MLTDGLHPQEHLKGLQFVINWLAPLPFSGQLESGSGCQFLLSSKITTRRMPSETVLLIILKPAPNALPQEASK
jgi:hypothetical protein